MHASLSHGNVGPGNCLRASLVAASWSSRAPSLLLLSHDPSKVSTAGPADGRPRGDPGLRAGLRRLPRSDGAHAQARERLATGYDASPEAARAILDASAGLTRVLNLAVALFMALLVIPYAWLPGLGAHGAVALGIAIIVGAMAWAVWSLKSVHGGLERAGPAGWTRRLERDHLQQSEGSAPVGTQDLRLWHHTSTLLTGARGCSSAPSSSCRWALPRSELCRPSVAEPSLDPDLPAAHHPHGTRPTLSRRGSSTWASSLRRSLSSPSSYWDQSRSPPPRPARWTADHRLRRLDRPHVPRPGRDPGDRHAVRVPLRPARRADQAAARQRHGAVRGRVLEESPDGLVYEFKLREGLRFHNGDPVTAEDVKFSFHRYRGASAKLLHERVKAVDIVDPHRVRFVLHTPWPGLPRLLRHPGHRRGVDRAQEVHREGRRGRLQAPARGARTLSVRAHATRAWSSCSRRTSSTGGRSRRSSAWSSRASPTARRAWPCSRPGRRTSAT